MTTQVEVVPRTTIFRICERWTMPVAMPREGDESWFLDWVVRSPKQSGHHLTAGWLAYASLLSAYGPEDIRTVHESFGGMGAHSLMIQEVFRPERHTIGEYAALGVEHLRRVLPASVEVRQADAYDDPLVEPSDLFGVDIPDFTAWRSREGQPHRLLFDKLFGMDPKAVVITDISCRYLHLHRQRYESILGKGTCGSYPEYLFALSARLEALYGFTLVRGYYDRWSSVLAYVPDTLKESVPGELIPTPSTPVGLEIF